MGNIKFEKDLVSQTGLYIPPTNQYITKWNQFNFSSYIIPVTTGDCLIFPSDTHHHTEMNTTDQARISISGDILLTMKKGIKTEHCIPHPSGWDTISN
jgi:ectoine hydroxylase-related dioxygenase (phytanoyl-CoA dioxygenase family)